MTNKILTKADLINTKFDAQEWTDKMKTRFQEKCFELGFTWCGQCIIKYVEEDEYYLNNMTIAYTSDPEFFKEDSCKQLFYSDIFPEQVVDTPTVALSEELFASECHYTKCTFTKASEALSAFEEGEELFTKVYTPRENPEYKLCADDETLLKMYNRGELYQKVVKPWYEGVCEEKPIYGTFNNTLYKLTHFNFIDGDPYVATEDNLNIRVEDCIPLTPSQVDDIVKTMKLWEK